MSEWTKRLKTARKDQILILLLIGLLLVVIAWPSGGDQTEDSSISKEKETEETDSGSTAEMDNELVTELEARLAGILCQVEGIGQTRVMITLKSDGKKVVEKDTSQSESKTESSEESSSSVSSQSDSSEDTVYEINTDGSETPFVTEELAPEVQGVLVIAQGAESAAVVSEITEAVMALFGIEAHKIKVMKME